LGQRVTRFSVTKKNRLRDTYAQLFSTALLSPVKEINCFGSLPKRRVDVFTKTDKLAYDMAIVSPFAHVKDACSSTGGAATAYDAVKFHSYGVTAENPSLDGIRLVPLVYDTFGAPSNAAREVLSSVAQCIANRFGQHKVVVLARCARTLSIAFQSAIGSLLLGA